MLYCYSVYRQETMKQDPAELGISLSPIPPGFTDERQPLDGFVFGAMKAHSRRAYRTHAAALESTNKQMAAPFRSARGSLSMLPF
jgi:hypothetical protein